MRPVRLSVWFVGPVLAGVLCSCSTPSPAPVDHPAGHYDTVPDTYVIVAGDTLYTIAWRYGLDYEDIARANRIRNPNRIYVGQTLNLKPLAVSQTAGASTLKKVPAQADRPVQSPTKTPAAAKPSMQATSTSTNAAWRWPAQGSVVRGSNGNPLALKIMGRTGQEIVAAAGGNVVYSGSGLRGYGKLIIVKHNNDYLSAYGYNRTLLVAEGQKVSAGQKIAEMGDSDAGQAGLHFEIRRHGEAVDALRLLPR